jgi:hypothetical protein
MYCSHFVVEHSNSVLDAILGAPHASYGGTYKPYAKPKDASQTVLS